MVGRAAAAVDVGPSDKRGPTANHGARSTDYPWTSHVVLARRPHRDWDRGEGTTR